MCTCTSKDCNEHIASCKQAFSSIVLYSFCLLWIIFVSVGTNCVAPVAGEICKTWLSIPSHCRHSTVSTFVLPLLHRNAIQQIEPWSERTIKNGMGSFITANKQYMYMHLFLKQFKPATSRRNRVWTWGRKGNREEKTVVLYILASTGPYLRTIWKRKVKTRKKMTKQGMV